MTCMEMSRLGHAAIPPYHSPFTLFRPRPVRRFGRFKMQDAYLDPYAVSASVVSNPHNFTIQPYHSPTSEDIFGNNALISSSTTSHSLTSHEHALLRLDTSGYPPILPKPPAVETIFASVPATIAVTAPATPAVNTPETHEVGQNYFVHDGEGECNQTAKHEIGRNYFLHGRDDAEAEYVNPQCVIFTFYTGDVNSVVDEHFKRSLRRPSSFSSEPSIAADDDGEGDESDNRSKSAAQDGNDSGIETNDSPVQTSHRSAEDDVAEKSTEAGEELLMCRRKFPPSFWNSDYWRDIKPTAIVPYDGSYLTYLNRSDSGYYYQGALTHASTPYRGSDALISAADPFSIHRQRAPSDALPYAYASASNPQSVFLNHTPGGPGMNELSYGLAANGGTFNPRYSSLLIQPTVRSTLLPAVPGQMELPKPSTVHDDWSPGGYPGLTNYQHYFSELPTYDTDVTPSIDSNDAKDLLWF